jgi:hypothetical protein
VPARCREEFRPGRRFGRKTQRLLIALAAAVTALAAAGIAHAATGRSEALGALGRAELALDGSPFGWTAQPDPTLALRDLALTKSRLPGRLRRRADRLLDRPDDPAGGRVGDVHYTVPSTMFCTTHFCVHYVESTADAPPLRDANGNGTPDWVERNADLLEFLWQKEVVEYGFRRPPADIDLPNHGPDGRFDVYLADIVDGGILGFCAPEPPPNYSFWNVPGYCVLDNDYSLAQIGAPGLGGIHELELTAVHEFFHAIQFGYDYGEDTWLLEGTATWIEDSVYDSFNEPDRRFPYSALRRPSVPVDDASATQPFQYGSWVFWRFLEEYLARTASKKDPSVIRRVWELADGSPGMPDRYSLQAVTEALAQRGRSLASSFREFAVWNFLPGRYYREGRTWPSAPVSRTTTVGPRRTVRGAFLLDHLSSQYVAFVPGGGTPRTARLSVSVALPSTGTGSTAALIVLRKGRRPDVRPVRLSLGGRGRLTVPFGRGIVTRVVLVLANGSNRFSCRLPLSVFSCHGKPLDDRRRYAYTVSEA